MQLRETRCLLISKRFLHLRFWWLSFGIAALVAPCSAAPPLKLTPYHESGIYELGEKVGWTVTTVDKSAQAGAAYNYTAKKNNLDVIKSGELDLSSGADHIELQLNEPAMVYVEVKPATDDSDSHPIVAGAAVAPAQLKPDAPRPYDFDAFWTAKIEALKAVPAKPVLTAHDDSSPEVEYSTITLDNFDGSHIHGQIAKPKREGKLPALVIFQWASPPYPLQKTWVT